MMKEFSLISSLVSKFVSYLFENEYLIKKNDDFIIF